MYGARMSNMVMSGMDLQPPPRKGALTGVLERGWLFQGR